MPNAEILRRRLSALKQKPAWNLSVAVIALIISLGACGGGGSSSSGGTGGGTGGGGTGGGGTGGGGTPAPSITIVSPSKLMLGIPLGQVTLYGQNFEQGSTVLIDGVAATSATIPSTQEIDIQISLDLDGTAGVHQIQVKDLEGTSNTGIFTVYSPTIGPQPFNAIQGFDPAWAQSNLSAIADVNGDGLADVVMAGPNGTTSLTVMLGQSNGQLGLPNNEPNLVAGPMVAGDVNGDGFVDLVCMNGSSANPMVSVLLNDGKGNFTQGTTTGFVGVFPVSLTLIDVDGDGKLDFLFGVTDTQSIYYMHNQGNGVFAAPVKIATSSGALSNFAAGDFTGDSKPDVAYAITDNKTGNSQLHLLVNQGGGSFTDQTVPSVTAPIGSLIAGDFNHDGHLDLAIQPEDSFTSIENAILAVYLGNGDGTFNVGPVTVIETNAFESYTLVAGDFDGDGNLDLAGVNQETEPGRTVILWGDNTGNFTPQFITGPMGFGVVEAGDINGDAITDLIVPDRFGIISVIPGNKSRSFPSVLPLFPNSGGAASAADINKDGKKDIFIQSNTTYLNQGNDTFSLSGSPNAQGLFVVDMDGDGFPDLIGTDGQNLLIWKGTGDPNFSGTPVTAGPGNPAFQIQIVDMDGDGLPDIVEFDGGSTDILFNQGNLSFFQMPIMSAFDSPFAIADVNGDGRPDFITGNFTLLNQGNRNFTVVNSNNLTVTAGAYIAVGDFNGDGKADVVYGGNEMGLVVEYGRGDGTFYQQSQLNVGPSSDFTQSLAVADVDGDGKADIVACLFLSQQCAVFTNDGTGGFKRSYFASGATSIDLLLTDLNGDGKPDLVISNYLVDFAPPNVNVVFHK
jgi:FG-GAP-like repeat